MAEEKRKQARYDSLNLSYICEDEAGSILHEGMGRTINVSEGGILLETSFPLNPANSLILEIALEDDIIAVRGKVAHSHQVDQKTYQAGVEFTELTDIGQMALERFVDLYKKKQTA